MSADSPRLPLEGLRVIEFTHMVMGPTCGMVLAGMGEDVGMLTPEQVEAIVIYEREVIGQEGQTARSSD